MYHLKVNSNQSEDFYFVFETRSFRDNDVTLVAVTRS